MRNDLKTMGYLGPAGTFSHCAASIYKKKHPVHLKPSPAFTILVDAVAKKEIDIAIVPVENSIEGAVGIVLDLLSDHATINIIAELLLPVTHRLLVSPGRSLKEITRVISHPQAIGQCRCWLTQHLPQADIIETASTALAASTVAQSKEPWAAIGTAVSENLYNLHCLAQNINDYANNTTRFLIIATETVPVCNNYAYKTSIEFTLLHQPGALYKVLGEFSQRDINLTRIESRPTKTELGRYRFFIDFTGHQDEQPVSKLLSILKQQVRSLRVLGSYPAGD